MTATRAERSALLKVRNQRRLNWEEVASTLRSLGLAALRISDDEHERVTSRFWNLDPCAALVQNSAWAKQAEAFAKDRFAVLIGNPWHSDDRPIARVAGPALAAKSEALLTLFVDGFFFSDPGGDQFFFVDANEDSLTGEFVIESALLEVPNAED